MSALEEKDLGPARNTGGRARRRITAQHLEGAWHRVLATGAKGRALLVEVCGVEVTRWRWTGTEDIYEAVLPREYEDEQRERSGRT